MHPPFTFVFWDTLHPACTHRLPLYSGTPCILYAPSVYPCILGHPAFCMYPLFTLVFWDTLYPECTLGLPLYSGTPCILNVHSVYPHIAHSNHLGHEVGDVTKQKLQLRIPLQRRFSCVHFGKPLPSERLKDQPLRTHYPQTKSEFWILIHGGGWIRVLYVGVHWKAEY